MSEFEGLLHRVVEMETDLQILHARYDGGERSEALLSRMQALETDMFALKGEIVRAVGVQYTVMEPTLEGSGSFVEIPAENGHVIGVPADSVPGQRAVEDGVPNRAGFRVRNTGVAQSHDAPHEVSVTEEPVRPRKNMELQLGKTIMSVLASVLILFSIIMFGTLIYPFLSDGAKVVIMYLISGALIGVGMRGRKGKQKSFFTALAGTGIAAFYISGIISFFVFQAFGVVFLAILTYAWILAVAWISRERVPIFAVICYVGIIISTCLCLSWFEGSVIGLGCYLLSLLTLFLFNRTGDYTKDRLYFLQFPVAMLFLAFYYAEVVGIVALIMIAVAAVFVVQRHIYPELTDAFRVSLILSEVMLFVAYQVCNFETDPGAVLNLVYIMLAGVITFWSYNIFEARFLKLAPLCFMCICVPLLNYGGTLEQYVGFIPFAMAILCVAYVFGVDLLKGVACAYAILYIFDAPYLLSDQMYFFTLLIFVIEFGVLYWLMSYGRHLDTVIFMVATGVAFSNMVFSDLDSIMIFGYWGAVLLSCVFNSSTFTQDVFIERLGWAWNGYWMSIGTAYIMNTPSSEVLMLMIFFIAVLIAYCVNVKWNLECEHPFAGIELCLKCSVFVGMLLNKLTLAGVVVSIAFMLLAIGCVVLGFNYSRKSIRLYGLILAIASVVKCLMFDIEYNSSIYLPVGLFVTGLLCFGMSWLYSVLEKRVREHSDE